MLLFITESCSTQVSSGNLFCSSAAPAIRLFCAAVSWRHPPSAVPRDASRPLSPQTASKAPSYARRMGLSLRTSGVGGELEGSGGESLPPSLSLCKYRFRATLPPPRPSPLATLSLSLLFFICLLCLARILCKYRKGEAERRGGGCQTGISPIRTLRSTLADT